MSNFKNIDNVPMVLTFVYPPKITGNPPEIEFTVKRAPKAYHRNAEIESLEPARREGANSNLWIGYFLVDYLKPLITGWKCVNGDETPPFSQEALGKFLENLGVPERKMLGISYMFEVNEDLKKVEPATSSEPAS